MVSLCVFYNSLFYSTKIVYVLYCSPVFEPDLFLRLFGKVSPKLRIEKVKNEKKSSENRRLFAIRTGLVFLKKNAYP